MPLMTEKEQRLQKMYLEGFDANARIKKLKIQLAAAIKSNPTSKLAQELYRRLVFEKKRNRARQKAECILRHNSGRGMMKCECGLQFINIMTNPSPENYAKLTPAQLRVLQALVDADFLPFSFFWGNDHDEPGL